MAIKTDSGKRMIGTPTTNQNMTGASTITGGTTPTGNRTPPPVVSTSVVTPPTATPPVNNTTMYTELNGPLNNKLDTAPGQVVDKPNVATTGTTGQVAGSYKDNGDGTFTQYLSDGTTTTTNTRPITGADVDSQQYKNAGLTSTQLEEKNIMGQGLETPTADKLMVGGTASLMKDLEDYKSYADQQQANIDLAKQKKIADLETLKINVNSQIDEVQRTAERNFAIAERAGAMSGAAMSGMFTQGLQNIKDDATRTINKLNNLYQIASNLTGAAADKAMTDYERALSDATRQFNYDHRDIMAAANYDFDQINKTAESMGFKFDPEKLGAAVGALSLKIQSARADNIQKYMNTVKTATDILNTQADTIQTMTNTQNLKAAQVVANLNANDGAAIPSLTMGAIDDYVTQGVLTPALAATYKQAGLQKAFDTLVSYAGTRTYDGKIVQPGVVPQEDIKQLQSLVNQGMSFSAAAQLVISQNQDRYANKPIITPTEQANINQSNASTNASIINAQKTALDTALLQQQYNTQQQVNTGNQIVDTISSPQTQESIYQYSSTQRNGDTTLQCGELVNDYIKMTTGVKGGMGNTYESKIKAIDNIGKSATPQVGGVFAQQFGTTGHTGIVTGVNPDGSITVYDANFENYNKDKGAVPVSRTIPANEISKLKFSVPVTAKQDIKSDAISVITGISKFTQDQKNSVINSIRNGDNPGTVIKGQLKNMLGGPQQTALEKAEELSYTMRDLDKTFSEYYANGGETGLIKGTFEQIINKLGTVNDPKLVSIATKLGTALQAYRNAISGTAYSNQEGQEIAKVFPSIRNSKKLNDAIFAGRLQVAENDINKGYIAALNGDEALWNRIKQLDGGATNTTTNNNPSSPSNGRRANANR